MSDLTAFADHARRMAEAQHKPECLGENPARPHPALWWVHPNPTCPGCVTDAERALWAQLADEVDAYLSHDEEDALL